MFVVLVVKVVNLDQVLLAHFVYVYAPQIVCSSMKAVDIKRLRNKNLEQQSSVFVSLRKRR